MNDSLRLGLSTGLTLFIALSCAQDFAEPLSFLDARPDNEEIEEEQYQLNREMMINRRVASKEDRLRAPSSAEYAPGDFDESTEHESTTMMGTIDSALTLGDSALDTFHQSSSVPPPTTMSPSTMPPPTIRPSMRPPSPEPMEGTSLEPPASPSKRIQSQVSKAPSLKKKASKSRSYRGKKRERSRQRPKVKSGKNPADINTYAELDKARAHDQEIVIGEALALDKALALDEEIAINEEIIVGKGLAMQGFGSGGGGLRESGKEEAAACTGRCQACGA